MSLRKALITISDIRSTKVIDKPMPIPLATEVVTASDEHKPIISIKSGFSRIKPLVKI
jgi:hypothetical protein